MDAITFSTQAQMSVLTVLIRANLFGDGVQVPWTSQVTLTVKNPPTNAGDLKRRQFKPWFGKMPWRRAWQPTLAFLPGESHGQRSLVGHSQDSVYAQRDHDKWKRICLILLYTALETRNSRWSLLIRYSKEARILLNRFLYFHHLWQCLTYTTGTLLFISLLC